MKVASVGGGAAGAFCAVLLKWMAPAFEVDVYEAASRPMKKLALTGGGRCNISNSFESLRSLSEAYPRGERLMSRALKEFSVRDTLAWFEGEGVRFVLQDDHCWFPESQDAMEIVGCLEKAMARSGVRVHCGARLKDLRPSWELHFEDGKSAGADAVLVTTGGAPKGITFLSGLELEMVPPVPSLFTFRVRESGLNELMGLVQEAELSIPGTKFRAGGPLLLTDWGLSGPAALRLSSYAARYLAEHSYKAPLSINWLPGEDVPALLAAHQVNNSKKLISNGLISRRLWDYLCRRAGLREDMRWGECGRKGLNKLAAVLTQDGYSIDGRAEFREEFVTCGGVDLKEINPATMESRKYPGLFFAVEVLDIDAITGGFNLQAAWSTAALAAKALSQL